MAVTTMVLSQEAGLLQVLQKCDSHLLGIVSSMSEQETALAARASELESLAARASARTQNLHIASSSVASVKEELETARLKAKLSEGTLAEGEGSLKTLEKKLLRLEKQEHELKAKCTREAAADATRETSAWAAIHLAQSSLQSLTNEQQATNTARESAFNDLGQARKQAVLAGRKNCMRSSQKRDRKPQTLYMLLMPMLKRRFPRSVSGPLCNRT